MPDHLHVLAVGERVDSMLLPFVSRFRQVTGFWYSRAAGRTLWQGGYYERVLREAEETAEVVRYILGNPVRAGLARAIGEYRWAGSDVYALAEIVGDLRNGRRRPRQE